MKAEGVGESTSLVTADRRHQPEPKRPIVYFSAFEGAVTSLPFLSGTLSGQAFPPAAPPNPLLPRPPMASPRSRPPASPQPSLDFRSTDTMPRGDVCPCLPEVSCVGRRTRLGFSPLPLHRPDPTNQSSDVSRHPPFASSGTFPGLTDGFSTPTTSTWTSAAPAAPAALLHTSSLLQIFSPTPVFHPISF